MSDDSLKTFVSVQVMGVQANFNFLVQFFSKILPKPSGAEVCICSLGYSESRGMRIVNSRLAWAI